MLISNLINNNYVAAIDDEGNEVVVMGTGIGYGAQKGSYIPDEKIKKIYVINNSNTIRDIKGLFQNISEDCFQVCGEIIDYTKKKLNTELNPNLYVTLTDHVNYTIIRNAQGIRIENPMIEEIKLFYPNEYAIGKYAVSLVKNKLGVDLGEDEAGFIAFHIVNAEANTTMHTTMKVTKLVKTALAMIEDFFGIKIQNETINFSRLITHLQFIANSVLSKKHSASKTDVFNNTIKNAFSEENDCSLKIADYIRANYDYELDDDELAYLTVHISRVRERKE